MKVLLLVALLAAAAVLVSGNDRPAAGPVPVVIELFTSEGCSSCPPADALLASIAHQSSGSVQIIPLGEHVDYWNQLGWKDRFSSHLFSTRQDEYARHFGLDGVYTPQMVIDGRIEFVGNDAAAARRAIEQVSHSPKPARVSLRKEGSALDISVLCDGPVVPAVWLAVTENDLTTQVRSGENGGRQLHHQAVVRSLARLGTMAGGRFHSRQELRLEGSWDRQKLNAVVFAQDQKSGVILGASAEPLR